MLFASAGLTGCSDSPTGPDAIPGSFELTAIGGNPVPRSMTYNDRTSTVTAVRFGELEVGADGSTTIGLALSERARGGSASRSRSGTDERAPRLHAAGALVVVSLRYSLPGANVNGS